MGKKNKDIIENTENTEQTENDSKENNRKSKNRFGRVKAYIKKHPYRILTVMLLCIALFILLRETGVISKHVYEKVENLAEREGVCFDNLLLSSMISIYNDDGEGKLRYLCIFNNGDVYCFEWPERSTWSIYYSGSEAEDYKTGYDETVWERMYNVVYLGRLSNWDIARLNRYVQDFDPEGKYYNIADTYSMEEPAGNGEGNRQSRGQSTEQGKWRIYSVCLYWHEQPEKHLRKNMYIEWCSMNYLGIGRYEKGEIDMKSYDENAIAALELFESSLFYYRWVFMCLYS